MPVTLLTLIDDDEQWKGSAIQDLSESLGIKTPTAREISNNYVFLKPVALFMPTKATFFKLWKKQFTSFQIPTCAVHSKQRNTFKTCQFHNLAICLVVCHSKNRPPQPYPPIALLLGFCCVFCGLKGSFFMCQTNRKIAITIYSKQFKVFHNMSVSHIPNCSGQFKTCPALHIFSKASKTMPRYLESISKHM